MIIPDSTAAGRPRLELPTPCSAPFDSEEWFFSVAWEGSRCLLEAAANGRVRLHGANGELTERFPEVAAAGPLDGAREAVLDVTVCVLDSAGRPDLRALGRRVATGAPRPLAVALATDILRCDGVAVHSRPLDERVALLHEVVRPDSRIQVPDHVTANGRALAAAAAGRGLSGLVARRRSVAYVAGVASPDRLSILLLARRDMVVMGWFSSADQVSVVGGEWVDGGLQLAGTAPVSDAATVRWLSEVAGPARTAPPGRDGVPPGVTWVRPHLVATVDACAPRLDQGLPKFELVALRDDVDPAWCVRRPAVEPPQAALEGPLRPFSPTVLSALPLGA